MFDKAYAKVNLALDVFNVREDGYHDLKSIMVPVDFYDDLDIEISDTDSFICNRSFLQYNESNSIYKMIQAFKEMFDIKDCFKVNLNKRVPTQAGLGGGTSDGACALRILQKIYNKNLSEDEIKKLCLKVGSDVLFSYYNLPAVVEGTGDIVKPFKIKKEYALLLVKPRSGVSTKQAYNLLDMNICDHPNIDDLKQALIYGKSIKGLLANSLEQPAVLLNKDINKIKTKLLENDAINVLMSGSGSCVFAIDEDVRRIKYVSNKMQDTPYFLRYTKILNTSDKIDKE